jgi:hypothetical protein
VLFRKILRGGVNKLHRAVELDPVLWAFSVLLTAKAGTVRALGLANFRRGYSVAGHIYVPHAAIKNYLLFGWVIKPGEYIEKFYWWVVITSIRGS